MPTAFENFVNTELPLRISCAVLPLQNTPGHYITNSTTTGRGSVWIKDNYSASAAPVVTNDQSSGQRYGLGSLWVWAAKKLVWLCIDPTTNNAIWILIAGRPYLLGG